MSRNRISNISLAVSSAGTVIILTIMVGILKALKSDQSTENNARAFSALIAFSGGAWCKCNSLIVHHLSMTIRIVLCAIPWFTLEQRRPGLMLPSGTNFLTIGFVQVYAALRECLKLKQTFLYLIFYFLM